MNIRLSRLMGLGLATLALAPHPLAAAEWSRWRGPKGDGISAETVALPPWPSSGPRQLWKTNVGTGFSSIAVDQGRIFTLGNSNNTDTVFCLSADTGDALWTFSYPGDLDANLYEGGPSATPTVDGSRVYTLGKSGELFCFDAAAGIVLWQKDLVNESGIRKPTWGFAGSPLIENEKLILNAGGHGMALNKTNGNLIWLSNTNRCGYSSPVRYVQDGVPAIVMFSERRVVAAALDDGRLLWSHPWLTPFDMNIADITLFNGDFFITSLDRSATLLNVLGASSALVWQNQNLNTVLSPGVLVGNHLYAFHATQDTPDEGELRCLDMRTGAVAWSTNMWVGSLISADNKLIILAGNGELIMAEANPTAYVELARAPVLQGRCWTLPALSGGRAYCRNAEGEIVALALAADSTPGPGLHITRATAPDRVHLAWPTNAPEFQLETTGYLAPDSLWTNAAGSPAVQGNLYVLQADPVGGAAYYRLRKP